MPTTEIRISRVEKLKRSKRFQRIGILQILERIKGLICGLVLAEELLGLSFIVDAGSPEYEPGNQDASN